MSKIAIHCRHPNTPSRVRRSAGACTLVLLAALSCPCWSQRADGADVPPERRLSMAEILKATTNEDWRELDPENTLYMELSSGRVVIELAPTFAPQHVANVKALVRENYFDGLAIIRAQDNYVVQWADPDSQKPDRARQVKNARETLPPEFDRPLDSGVPFTLLPDPDGYAPEVGFVDGFPVARDPASGRMWLIHCYGMVGAGRDTDADSGGGKELYAVIGHAPRHLDRNVTLFGRVIEGMERLSALPRGPGPMGFYRDQEHLVPIRAMRVAADLPVAERSRLQVLRTETDTFRRLVESRRNRPEAWFKSPAGHIEICNVPIPVRAAPALTLSLAGDWTVQVERIVPDQVEPITVTLNIPPAQMETVIAEKHEGLPMFNPNAGGWAKGAAPKKVRAQECTTRYLLDPQSFELRLDPDPGTALLRRDQDYAVDLEWATFGRLAGGSLEADQPVYVSYRCGQLRLDSIVLTEDGRIVHRTGEPRGAAPSPPALGPGEHRLANIWLPGRIDRLRPEHLFPISESAYPEEPVAPPSVAERLLPRAMAKLREGGSLRVLAWGDSVTDGRYLPDPSRERWQEQFVTRLARRFPRAKIELITEAWGGRNTASYLNEPPGSGHNYREKVLERQPDLIVSEFVNDAGLSPAQVEERYGRFWNDFQQIGAEWIILTPHYVRPDWMGLTRERDIDEDPRPYVQGLRQFATRHPVALADASLRYGRLWRQGIPYTTLMLNSINHPNSDGMRLFADSLLALFPAE